MSRANPSEGKLVIVEGVCDTCGVKVERRRKYPPEEIIEYLEKHHPKNGCLNPSFSHSTSREVG